jgi:hypothetical protein
MTHTLTCELCFIQSYLMGDERMMNRTNKIDFYKVRIIEWELNLQFSI